MCKSTAEGGQRCAAHTRPAYEAAAFGTPEWDEAAAQYAATPGGYKHVEADRESAVADAIALHRAQDGPSAEPDPDYVAAVHRLAAYNQALSRAYQIREAAAATKTALTQHQYDLPPNAPSWATNDLLAQLPPMSSLGKTTTIVDPERGLQEFDADGNLVRVWTEYESTDDPHPWLNDPQPNCHYLVRPSPVQQKAGADFVHVYRTTRDGSTEWAYAHNVQALKGNAKGSGEDREPEGFPLNQDFNRGHIIARQFGGGMDKSNLVSMPSAVNLARGPAWARRHGFHENADLMEHYPRDPKTKVGPTLRAGEVAMPNYRAFEQRVVALTKTVPGPISLLITPTTFDSSQSGRRVTDFLTATVYVPGRDPVTYRIDNDITG